VERARLHKMVWLEKNKIEFPDPDNPKETKTEETYKSVHLGRGQVKAYEKNAFKHLKKLAERRTLPTSSNPVTTWETWIFRIGT